MEITKKELKRVETRSFPKEVCFKPIGVIHTPFKRLSGIPIQASLSSTKGKIEIFAEYKDGLKDLEGFSHVICIYYFDMVQLPVPMQSKPFLLDEIKGVFAIRTPFRPNPIGFSILKIIQIEDNLINVDNIDILDKTPLIDIKPYIPHFDMPKKVRIGWIKNKIRKKVS